MSDNQFLDELPGAEGEPSQIGPEPGQKVTQGEDGRESKILLFWERVSGAGLSEMVFRLGTHILSIAAVLIVVWAMRAFYLRSQEKSTKSPPVLAGAALAAPLSSPEPTDTLPDLPEFITDTLAFEAGIPRLVSMHTVIPARPRTEIITYTVQKGDTIFGIATTFNLKPETILWGNYYTLKDNADNLQVGRVLNIMPQNGTYHKWSEGEGLNGVAKGYGVEPDAIINWPGNHLDVNTLGDLKHPNITAGTWLFVPGGHRSFVNWSNIGITRKNPGVAKILGPGSCGTVVDGAVGIGTFVWPANRHFLSGYDYSPETNHFGIDVSGNLGDPIYAADGGVIVYAGWNNWGYGNVVVIDHGTGWQTLYAHMSQIDVWCGASVAQGAVIGAFGSTGNSSGPHLHFEMLSEQYGKVNPHNFLP